MLNHFRNATLSMGAICAIVCGLNPSCYASEAASAAPDPVVFSATATVPSGPGGVSVLLGKPPSGKYFVAQTSSYYCNVSDPGATVSVIISAFFKSHFGYITLPSGVSNGTSPVGGALSATYYATTVGDSLSAGVSIDAKAPNGATCYLTVEGYYLNGTPND
jgi:hypothetical protein